MNPALIFFCISNGFISAPPRTRFSQESEHLNFINKVRVILAAESKFENERSFAGEMRMERMEKASNGNLNDDWELLLATIASPSCPFPIVKVLLDRFDSKISTFRDEHGNTMLHTALQAKPFSFHSFFKCDRCKNTPIPGHNIYFNRDPEKSHWGVRCTNPNCFRRDHNRSFHYVQVKVGKYSPMLVSNVKYIMNRFNLPLCILFRFSEIKERAVTEYILQKHPILASISNHSGLRPLEIALMKGRTIFSGIREIIVANPKSISQVDDTSGLYPFQLAAIAGGIEAEATSSSHFPPGKRRKLTDKENDSALVTYQNEHDLEQLSTIFELLLKCPSLIKPISC